jgi:hypothetical protein
MNKFIFKGIIGLNLAIAPIFAGPPSPEDVAYLKREANHKVECWRKSLGDVCGLKGREYLLNRAIGFIVLLDITSASNAADVMATPYFRFLIPSSDTRAYTESEWLYDKLPIDTLYYIATPSERAASILDSAQEGTYREIPRTDEKEYEYATENLGPLAGMFLVACADPTVAFPDFPEENKRGIKYWPTDIPVWDDHGKPNREFFTKYYKNLRAGFVETEAEGQLAHSLSAFLLHLGPGFLTSHLISSPDEKNGALSLSLEILIKRHPDALGHLQEMKRAFADPGISEQYPQNQKEIEQIREILQTVVAE